jgi:ribosomal protein L11 methyltransferase
MRTWPALEVRVGPDPDLLQAALVDYDVAAIDDNAPDVWRVFFHTTDERERARHGLASYSPAPVDVDDEDWAARSQASLHAIQVGRIVVAPPWDVPAASAAGPLTIVVQPSMGFGTGHHATTRLCLDALQRLDLRGRSVLDVGTGSGVLAIAASRLGAHPVVAIDDDADAAQAARENVALNAGTAVDVRVQDLRAGALGRFDVVLANLTGALLAAAAARLRDLTTPGGHLILSGFMEPEEPAVLTVFSQHRESFKQDTPAALRRRTQEDEWGCVTLQIQPA